MTRDYITRRIISERITHLAGRFAGGLGAMLFGVRIFLRYLHSSGFTNDDLSIAIPELIAPRKRVQEGFSPEIVDKLLSAAGRTCMAALTRHISLRGTLESRSGWIRPTSLRKSPMRGCLSANWTKQENTTRLRLWQI
jgi:hypothetical protein